jgi:hypothetical protein
MDLAETAQVVSFEPVYLEAQSIPQPAVAVCQDPVIPTTTLPLQPAGGVISTIDPSVDPLYCRNAQREPQVPYVTTDMFTPAVHDQVSEMGAPPVVSYQPQGVVPTVSPGADHREQEQEQEQEQANTLHQSVDQCASAPSSQPEGAPYGGYYPSLDDMSSSDFPVHQTTEPPSWDMQNSMWTSEREVSVEIKEEEGEEEKDQKEELSLEDYLLRHNIQRTPAAEEEDAKAETEGDAATVQTQHVTADEVADDDMKQEEERETEQTTADINFPTAPSSIPSVMFPAAPTHEVSLSSASSSAAASRGEVGESDPHGSQGGVRREKEVSTSGRGVPSGGHITNAAFVNAQPPPSISYPSLDISGSMQPRFSQGYAYENPPNDDTFSTGFPLPMATSVSEDYNADVVDEPFQIKKYPFPPLSIPDDIFLPAHRLHACNEAIQIDNNLAMSILGHSISSEKQDSRDLFPCDVHHPAAAVSEGPLCQVQVLRSVSEWSAGSKTEKSILDAWITAIESARHLVYIENSLFVSVPKSSGNKKHDSSRAGTSLNGIAEALVTRLVAAASNREQFRVIVILPQHASGDFCDPHRHPVLEKNMAMQCRGIHAIIESFQSRCPDVIWSEYLGFFCLRNWGVMNEKVVHSQVYVSSSVLIVDDRVAVVGGAAASDQGMRGTQDSNVAVLIEDTTPVSVQLGGGRYEASRFAHMLRVNLMRHHVGDHDPFSADLHDMASHLHTPLPLEASGDHGSGGSVSGMNGYDNVWQSIANRNAELYKALDGEYSVYSIKTLDALKKKSARDNYVHKSEHDAQVQTILGGIQGFLVPFPLEFRVS